MIVRIFEALARLENAIKIQWKIIILVEVPPYKYSSIALGKRQKNQAKLFPDCFVIVSTPH